MAINLLSVFSSKPSDIKKRAETGKNLLSSFKKGITNYGSDIVEAAKKDIKAIPEKLAAPAAFYGGLTAEPRSNLTPAEDKFGITKHPAFKFGRKVKDPVMFAANVALPGPGEAAYLPGAAGLLGSIRRESPTFKKATEMLRELVDDREFRTNLGKVAELIEKKGKNANRANLGKPGEYLHSLGESLFGKDEVANLTNTQLYNAVDLAFKDASTNPKLTGLIGLSAKNTRGALKRPVTNQTINDSPNLYFGGGKYDPQRVGTKGISLTSDPSIAKSFKSRFWADTGRNGSVTQFSIDPKARILKSDDIPADLVKSPHGRDGDYEKILDYARSEGYDAVDLSRFKDIKIWEKTPESEIRVFNPKVLKEREAYDATKDFEENVLGLPPKGVSTNDVARPVTGRVAELQKELAQSKTKSNQLLLPAKSSVLPELAQEEVISAAKNLKPSQKVNLLDYIRTPINVLRKIGLEKEGKLLEKKYDDYLQELPKELDKVTQWAKKAKDPGSSQRLFRYLDGQTTNSDGTPLTLSKEEQEVAVEIAGYLRGWADRLKLPKDKRIASYITHIFDEDFIQKEFDPEIAKLIQDRIPGSVYDPFLEQRLGALGFKEDAWQALDAYIKRGVRKANMDEALEPLSKAAQSLDLESYKYVQRLGEKVNLRPSEIDNLLDNLIKASPVGYKLGARPTLRVTRGIRQMVYRGTLGLNVGSAMRNLTQGVNTYAELGEKYTPVGYAKMVRALASKSKELEEVGVLSNNFIEDRSLNATKKFWQNADKGLFSLFEFAEKVNRGAAYYGAKARALDKGLSEEEAIQAGKDLVAKTQFRFGSVHTPVALQGDVVKFLTQFQSYNVKQAEYLLGKVKKREAAGLIRYTGASLLLVATFGQLFGMRPTDMIPFFGVATGETKLGQTPPIQAAMGAGKIAFGDEQAKTEGRKEITRAGIAMIPGGVQTKKTIEGLQATIGGGSKTTTGRNRFSIEPTPTNVARAAVFGPNNFQEAQDYFAQFNGGPSKDQRFYAELKLAAPEERARMIRAEVAKDPEIINKIEKMANDERLGTTDEEKRMRTLPVRDGTRAKKVQELLQNTNPSDRAVKLRDLVDKKVITEEVLDQLIELSQ